MMIPKECVEELPTSSISEENITKLKQIFPEAFTEDGIDFTILRQLLGDQISDTGEEKYRFSWHGKTQARELAVTPSLGTLRPYIEESLDWENAKNLFIEGDNLEVLKLLQKSYGNKIKMIYIDPPYNTGKDFIYSDKFQESLDHYLQLTGQKEGGCSINTSNPESSGRKHTNWLNMMYPRLKLARTLLREDGVIFISIDDNEQANLKKICDEIFGEENFVANFLWKKKGTTSNVKDAQVSSQVDYQLCFGKSEAFTIKQRVKSTEDRTYPNQDDEGNYRTTAIEKKDSGAYKRDTMKFEILGHKPRAGKRWQIGERTARVLEGKNRFIWDGEKILLKIYEFEDSESYSAQPNLLDSHGTSDAGAKLANNELFSIPELFDNPKPIELIKYLISISTNKDEDLILDFFSGSSTTAHAVMQLNAEDGGGRKYIMVQLPEPCNEKSEAYKAGYKTIADIGKERIRRAANKIKEDKPEYKGDLGFKVFKLDTSNFKVWQPDKENLVNSLFDYQDNFLKERSEEDILYELLLRKGFELATKIEKFDDADQKYTIYIIDSGKLIACLSDSISENNYQDIGKKIIERQKECSKALGDQVLETQVFFKDGSFVNDLVKIDLLARLSQAGIKDVHSL